MVRRTTHRLESPRQRFTALAMGLSALLLALPVFGAESSGPWECSNYTGDAHTRCLQAFIEIQREKISKLEAEVHLQQSTVGQLKDQADRQKDGRCGGGSQSRAGELRRTEHRLCQGG